jgi:hypothetical protein
MESKLSYLNDEERLKAYLTITAGCEHIYSKGKLQKEKLNNVLTTFITLAEKDPYFLAHFTSYAVKNLDSKDLKVVSIFANSLSDADGTPFIIGKDAEGRPAYGEAKKPNLRVVSQGAIQLLEPKLVKRVIELANLKQKIGSKKEATHFSRSLKTAIKKYLQFRENYPRAAEGLKKAGLSPIIQYMYKALHLKPSKETAEILGWKQGSRKKNNLEEMKKKDLFSFKGLSDLEIAEKIRKEQIPALGAISALPSKISPVIAVALLEQCTGNQAVILRGLFDGQGLLKHKEVLKFFEEKIKTAKTALDRVEKINTEIDSSVAEVLKDAKAEKRKKDLGNIGKIFLHIDVSSSMESAVEYAKNNGATIAECIQNPEENFHWGIFNNVGKILQKPSKFTKDAFMAALYGIRSNGMTDCLALYEQARRLGCDVDIYITDQGHNGYPVQQRIMDCDRKGLPRPTTVVIIDFSHGMQDHGLKDEFEKMGIPVSTLKPTTLNESALVVQAIKAATTGAIAVIDTIMETPLIKLPEWWETTN